MKKIIQALLMVNVGFMLSDIINNNGALAAYCGILQVVIFIPLLFIKEPEPATNK